MTVAYRFRHRDGTWRWVHDECRSGYTESRISVEEIEREGGVLLMRPFSVREPAARVTAALE